MQTYIPMIFCIGAISKHVLLSIHVCSVYSKFKARKEARRACFTPRLALLIGEDGSIL